MGIELGYHSVLSLGGRYGVDGGTGGGGGINISLSAIRGLQDNRGLKGLLQGAETGCSL